MPLLLWDASGLGKRYVAEVGTPVVNALFAAHPRPLMAATALGYAEVFSTILRHRNRGAMSGQTFVQATSSLRSEVLYDPTFELLTVSDAAVFAGLALMELHNINATDAAILRVFLDYSRLSRSGGPVCVVVASDRRLLAAAQAEGLATLNPETFPAGDIAAFIAGS